MSLTEELRELAENSVKRHPGEAQEIMKAAIEELEGTDILEKAFKTGDSIPAISLPNANGVQLDIRDILKDKRVVLAFYRGAWCPYCNLELKALQEALPQIEAKGAQLVAISPQTPDNSMTSKEKNDLSFEVLSDTDNGVARAMNLVYELPDALVALYTKFGIDLASSNGGTAWELPIAATYIIEQDGSISYHYLEEDYKLRADPQAILDAL
ncbi:peroxiredoxin-like family protein [Spongiimicrobium salis]|uniref:peroxiredoxin-like family protein n=1 Tax=Spongiimicrobium salis TaxID=1667022 RepID=UPI00374CD50D